MKFDLTTIDWTAIASLLTLLIAVIAVVPIIRDKGKIKIGVEIELYPDEGEPFDDVKYYKAKLVVTNVGLRKIGIRKWGKTVNTRSLLSEEELADFTCEHCFEMNTFLEEGQYIELGDYVITRVFPRARNFYVLDTSGKKWKTSNIKLFAKKQSIKKYLPIYE